MGQKFQERHEFREHVKFGALLHFGSFCAIAFPIFHGLSVLHARGDLQTSVPYAD